MADEEKSNPDIKPADASADKPADTAAPVEDKYKTQPLSAIPVADQPKTEAAPPAEKPAKPAAPAAEVKAAGTEAKAPADKPAAKPVAKAPPKKPAEVETIAIPDDPIVVKLKSKFPNAVIDANAILKQKVIRISRDSSLDVCRYLRDEPSLQFNLLVDLTALHHPKAEKQFEVIYILYSIPMNQRIRLKVPLSDGESIASVVSLWGTANWLEREAYDMFGIRFDGHPDLRRILLPEDWVGYPLRKEYPLEFEENEWVAKHLNIRPLAAGADYTGKFE